MLPSYKKSANVVIQSYKETSISIKAKQRLGEIQRLSEI